MAHRHLNLFDGNQSNFTNRDRSNLGGWTVASSDTSAKRLDNRGFYAAYNPNARATFIEELFRECSLQLLRRRWKFTLRG